MKILFIKNLLAHDGKTIYSFKRMKVYNIPNEIAKSLIERGFGVKFCFIGDPPLTNNNMITKEDF